MTIGQVRAERILSVAMASAIALTALSAEAQAPSREPALAPLHILATPADDPDQPLRTANPGETIIVAELAYARTAQLDARVTIPIPGVPITVRPDHILRAGADARSDREIACTGKMQLPKEARSVRKPDLPKGPVRFKHEISLCLTDTDRDQHFDQAQIFGANWAEDQRPIPIAKARYQIVEFSPSVGLLRLVYEKGALMQGPILQMQSSILDGSYQYADARFGETAMKPKWSGGERSVKAREFPKTLNYGDASIVITGLHPETRLLSYRIVRGFQRTPAVVKVGFYGTYASTTYTFE